MTLMAISNPEFQEIEYRLLSLETTILLAALVGNMGDFGKQQGGHAIASRLKRLLNEIRPKMQEAEHEFLKSIRTQRPDYRPA